MRKVVEVRTVIGIQEDKWKDMPLVASVLPGTQQVRICKFVSSVDLENYIAASSVQKIDKMENKKLDLCHFSRKGTICCAFMFCI